MIPLQKRSTALGSRGSSEHGLPPQLDRQEVDPGVEADDELAALSLDRFGDPIRERRDRGRLVVRSHAHAAKATPFVAARIALRSSATTRSSGAGRRMKVASRSSSSAAIASRSAGSVAIDLAQARIDLEVGAAATRHGPTRDDATRNEDGAHHPRLERGHDEARAHRPQPPELVDPVDDLLERRDPIAQPGGILEAEVAREPPEPQPQAGENVAADRRLRSRRAPAPPAGRATAPRSARAGSARCRRPSGRRGAAGRRGDRAACRARSPAA